VSLRPGRTVVGAGLAAAALLLQGCATAKPAIYGPIGPEVPYGYKDRPNADGGHTVLVVMAGHATAAELRVFFDRRAAELCPAGIDRTNIFRVHAAEYYASAPYVYGSAGVGSRARVGVELEGYVYCKPGADAPKAE
jgi:hypothetical protein